MLNWLRQLLSGDQNAAIPEDAAVERDEHGRVVRVQQTLSVASQEAEATQLPWLKISEASRPALDEASQWLCAQNIQAARCLGIGLENTFSFDQNDGLLRLFFDRREPLLLPSQLLGSFTPHNRIFMWGWHNPSFHPQLQIAAQKARKAGQQLGEAAFDIPMQVVTFNQLTPLLAFAARASGCDGIYRAVLEDDTSIFVGYQIPEKVPRLPLADAAFEALALARAESYDRDMLAQDAYYQTHKESEKDDLLDKVIAAKMVLWQRDWASDDEYWHPCSSSWPSEHDRALSPIHFIAPHPNGGVLDCRIGPATKITVYHIKAVGDEAKIVNEVLDWGLGFIWPGSD